jgi:hypothetical protein
MWEAQEIFHKTDNDSNGNTKSRRYLFSAKDTNQEQNFKGVRRKPCLID